jgi:membrane dipeptidase
MPSDAMQWIDGHLDLACLAVRGRDLRIACADVNGCVTLPALREGGVALAFATIFAEPGAKNGEPWGYSSSADINAAHDAGVRQLEAYDRLEAQGEVAIVRSRGDLNRHDVPLKLLLLMEGADPIRSPDEAAWWHERGVRMVGMTWAAGTRYAGGNAAPGGLTACGRDLVAAFDELGIVHDASHLADEALDDLLALARGRIVATHSNARSLLEPPRERHLRDDQIAALAGRGGIVGLNLYSRFLAAEGRATIAHALAHVQHVASVMGHRRGVALGSDMDGGFGPDELPLGLDHPAKLPALADALAEAGWTADEVAGFAHGNWLRLLRETLPA